MEISLVVQTILVLIPGIIGWMLFRRLRPPKAKKDWEDYLEIVMFGVLSYIVIFAFEVLLSDIYGSPHETVRHDLRTFQDLLSGRESITANRILLACFVAIIGACILSVLLKSNRINGVLRWLRVTNQTGMGDVWSDFNAQLGRCWVVVDTGDMKEYYGFITHYSEVDSNSRELLLCNVTVKNGKTQTTEHLTALYLDCPKGSLRICVPDQEGMAGELDQKYLVFKSCQTKPYAEAKCPF